MAEPTRAQRRARPSKSKRTPTVSAKPAETSPALPQTSPENVEPVVEEAPPQPQVPDGVWVTVEYNGDSVQVKNLSTTGTTRASEILSILSMGIKLHRQQMGIER